MAEEKQIHLKDLLIDAGKRLRQDFEEIKKSIPHSGESGSEAEHILKKFLKDRLPRRFDVESGFVVGANGTVSLQTDLIIFDALNCPIYRKGPDSLIVPRDNVATVIEVKSKLNKAELEDAAKKIASAKSIKSSPITSVDQPVTFSDMIMTNTQGIVFAFDSYTSLDALAENLRDINSKIDSRHWIDLVVVLDKGVLGYVIQQPFSSEMPGSFGGACSDDFPIPPLYVHLMKQDYGELALNKFFVTLMAQLTFFRQRSAVPFDAALGKGPSQGTTIQGYQYNLKRQLVPTQDSHKAGKYKNPKVRFNIYSKKTGEIIGQICLLPWQDGASITCSARVSPKIIYQHIFNALNLKGIFIQGATGEPIWYSSILPISEEQFIKAAQHLHPDIVSQRDGEDDVPPPTKITV